MGDHRRINEQLMEYWKSLKGSGRFPPESDFDNGQIEEVWDHCFLVEVKPENKSYKYTYLGPALIEAYGDNIEGREVFSKVMSPETGNAATKFDEVVKRQEPVTYEGEFMNSNKMQIRFRKILLPLGEDGKVTYIVGGMKWRAF